MTKLYVGYDGTGYFKIGITGDHVKRLKQIRTGNPTFTFLWCFECSNPQVTELEIHTKFNDKKVSGEWFELLPEDLGYISEKFVQNHGCDLFDTWNNIVNKKQALDKTEIKFINNYWYEVGKNE